LTGRSAAKTFWYEYDWVAELSDAEYIRALVPLCAVPSVRGDDSMPVRPQQLTDESLTALGDASGVTVTVFAFHVAGDRITRIWVVRNPEKLRPWTTG